MRKLLTASLLLLFFPGKSQMLWQNADSLYGPLPEGMHVFKTITPIDGKANIAYYVSAPLTKGGIAFDAQIGKGKRYTPDQYFATEGKPPVVVNCTFFSFADNRNLNLVIGQGELLAHNFPVLRMPKDTTKYYYLTRGGIGISARGKADVAWLFSDTAHRFPLAFQRNPLKITGESADPQWGAIVVAGKKQGEKPRPWKMETAVAGGPVLLQNGEIHITNKEERMFVTGEQDRHPRTAMGYTADGRLIILAIEGRNPGIAEGATLLQEAIIFKDLGCIEALNLDGGGSSCLLVNGKETIKPSDKTGQRPVPAVFLIRNK